MTLPIDLPDYADLRDGGNLPRGPGWTVPLLVVSAAATLLALTIWAINEIACGR